MNRPAAASRITLLTDFGTKDGFAAAMRGVIACRAPALVVEDATHEIAAGDVRAGAWALARYWRLYPESTVHVAVVDPGVGSVRRGIVVRAAERMGVGPDNGVLEPMLAEAAEIRRIDNAVLYPGPVSPTFHGRDVFAPTAAYLAAGGQLQRVGPLIDDPHRLEPAPLERRPDGVVGVVVHIDRFGNLITNIPAGWVAGGGDVAVRGRPVGAIRRTFSDVAAGTVLALIGSAGVLEIAVRDGDAARSLGEGTGAEVSVATRRS